MRSLILQCVRYPCIGLLIRWLFRYMSWSIPVKRLYETASLMAFHHPSPSYPIHILIVPKRQYSSLLDLSLGDSDFQHDLFFTVQKLIEDFSLQDSYRLICNGGENQDVDILHFHLISD